MVAPGAAVLLLFLGAVVLFGCSAQDNSPPSKYQIAAILLQGDQFYRLNEAGMRAAAKKYNVKLLVDNSQGKIDRELTLVDAYIAKGVDALLVPPKSQTGSVNALRRAHDAGIKIIVYDLALGADFPDCTIVSDQVGLGTSTGEEARRYIEEKLDGKANVAVIQYISQSLELGPLRPSGFVQQIEDMPGVKIVTKQDAWLADMATDVVETILGGNPELDIIWAANEGGTVGAVRAVRNTGKAGQVVVFGTDISEQLAEFLLDDDNVLQAVTAQKPFEMGYSALETAVKVLEGEPVEKEKILTGTLYTRNKSEEVEKIREQLKQLAE